MAGSILATPANGAADWSGFSTQVQRQYRGYMQISLSSMSAQSVLEPKVQAGSCIEIGGSLYQFNSEEAATAWSGIASASSVYMYCVPAGTVCSVSFSTDVPVFSDAKQGYYSSNDRAFAWLRKDSTAGYRYKHFLPQTFVDPIYFENVLEIGEWNMDATQLKVVTHDLAWTNIVSVNAMVINDANTLRYMLAGTDSFAVEGLFGRIYYSSTLINLRRVTGGFFDNTGYDATAGTVANRGYITIIYGA